MNDTLTDRQEAGKEVERRLIDFLLGYSPAQELKVCDVKQIAFAARQYSFDAYEAYSSTVRKARRDRV